MTKQTMEQNQSRSYHKVLTIAGSDSGGGAGIQADLKTISAIGCYGMSVITALTAQNTQGVMGVHAVPPAFVADQISAVFTDIGADAIKIGMLYSAELIETIATRLQAHGADNIVLDPVMVAQSGDRLVQDDAMDAMKKYLMPLARVVTPNIPEAELLIDDRLEGFDAICRGAAKLAGYGSPNILIKGGHARGNDSTDFLYLASEERIKPLKGERIDTRNNHGTGCTLSSAIAAYIARGHDVEAAVENAKSYIEHAIRAGARYTIGQGHGPVHHFFQYWE
uniref:hydroxymethylpyrimidine kinase n=1 Tax=Candidatus Kentrum sp. LFY TaxID=2126342 RepID=A0A450WIZ4_9GAMM|nr:MAG: hydroxymethylpyrimidine/phosphomethylpyrimidine kinase [Candidatus Kentron sp. LFY]